MKKILMLAVLVLIVFVSVPARVVIAKDTARKDNISLSVLRHIARKEMCEKLTERMCEELSDDDVDEYIELKLELENDGETSSNSKLNIDTKR